MTNPERTPDTIAAVVERMEELAPVVANDERRHFHATYLRTTLAIGDAVAAGQFLDDAWLERWDARFANLYLDALDAHEREQPVPTPWMVAFGAAHDTSLPPLRHVLLGMNAHINFDLPQATVEAISPDEFADPDLVACRERDHRRVDDVLADRVAAEDRELASGGRSLQDRLLTPLNRVATRRFIGEARAKVWHNARALDRARAEGRHRYEERLGELERQSAERVADLRAPGQVVLRLACHGFGVRLQR